MDYTNRMEKIASYYAEVFLHDWGLDSPIRRDTGLILANYRNPLLILFIYGVTFALIAIDWRKRRWT